ncbi:hypothetical protein ACFQRL_15310 [Microbacterium fluvii]|uniref:Excreted virulence factor EspC (Type VII ESX diderm) n=1 Tax=Microbacterium fluvii TaxID=415215 RepID=A0ABW2HGD8_9MICO|nr:hypothetical protein [Microbacterium fluvii]MCU4673960.1 hypothetical protein [Microbacterium fluvii]
MADIEYANADFDAAVTCLTQAGESVFEAFCPAFSVLGSSVVESALVGVDAVVKAAMTSLAGAATELATDTTTVHDELRRTDAALAGSDG